MNGRMRSATGWMTLVALLATTWLTACGEARTSDPPTTVQPDLDRYSKEFQHKLIDELEALPPFNCPRRPPLPPGCTALGTWAEDHQHLRDKIKAAKEVNDGH